MKKEQKVINGFSQEIADIRLEINFRKDMIDKIQNKIENINAFKLSLNTYQELKKEKRQYESEIENFDFYITGLEVGLNIFKNEYDVE